MNMSWITVQAPEDGDDITYMESNEFKLFQNVIHGNIDQIRDLLQNGADVSTRYHVTDDFQKTTSVVLGHNVGR